MTDFDVVVIGAGIAGASAAYEIASDRSVLLLEREPQPGYHATGRSAALFSETYGNAVVRALTVGSREFYLRPPLGFSDVPLLTPRGVMLLAREDQVARVRDWVGTVQRSAADVHMMNAQAVLARVPILRPDYVSGGAAEPNAMDIDVHALHGGYLRAGRIRGVKLATDAALEGLRREGDRWVVETAAGAFTATTIVNAAGAWAPAMPATAMIVDLPPGVDATAWPIVIDGDEEFYFRPDAGRLLLSPADETPTEPCDIQPDELEVAICIDRVQQAANLPVQRVVRSWAGLRSFVVDRTPVVGYDPAAPGFFWLAAQGGYGIQTAPAMGRLAAALLAGKAVPDDLQTLGVTADALAPGRAGLRSATERAA